MEKVREKTETAKQRGKKWVHWLTPATEGDDTAVTDERDNNNTGTKEPPAVLARWLQFADNHFVCVLGS